MKPLHWIGSSLKDLKNMPEEVRQEAGFSIYLAQTGEKAANAMPLVGFGGAKVLEVIIDDDGDTYRAVYTVKFAGAIYVLHAFQKKAKKGIATPRPDLDLIRTRLKSAQKITTEITTKTANQGISHMNAEHEANEMVTDSAGSVFADLGIINNEDDILKFAIAGAITAIVKKRELTQSDASEIIGIDQSKMSMLLRGRLKGFSVERMLNFLTMLGKDVDIRISAKSKNQPGRIKVIAA